LPREGILIPNPYQRINDEQLRQIHRASLEILVDPGLLCFSQQAAEIFNDNGAGVTAIAGADHPCWQIKIPEKLVREALDSTPKTVKLGARNPDNALIMKGDEPRVFFITGSETNIWLDVDFPTYVKKSDNSVEIQVPEFHPRRSTVSDLCQSAHVC
jgi:trimethylamine--corrinoid protein Co-methyltransferase